MLAELDSTGQYADLNRCGYVTIKSEPLALQLFNIYRARWVARHWQYYGHKVIPNINWTPDKTSLNYCCAGIPKGQIVAVRLTKDLLGLDWVEYGWHDMQ